MISKTWLARGLAVRWRSNTNEHRQILHGMIWVGSFVFLGKLSGAAKEMVVAWRYGVSSEVDAYLFMYNLVNWPVSVWFSVLTVVLMPLVARIRKIDPNELTVFRAELLGGTLVFGVVLALFLWVGLAELVRSPLAGLAASSVSAAESMVLPTALLAPLGLLVGLFSVWMMASGRHVNTLLEGVPAFVIAVTVISFATNDIRPLIWGTVAGSSCHVLSLALPLRKQGGLELPRWSMRSSHWPAFWAGFSVMLVGQALMNLTGIIDQFFAARLGTGAIATLSYANRVLSLILGLGAIAVSRATLPVFSKMSADGGPALNRIAAMWAGGLFGLGLIAAIAGWWAAPMIVKLLFERGAFSSTDTHSVAIAIRWGIVQLPFYFPAILLVSLLTSRKSYFLIAMIGAVNLVTKALFSYFLLDLLGVGALMLSTAIMLAASCAVLIGCSIRWNG